MSAFIQRYRNAKTVIAQIRAGEWTPMLNDIDFTHYTASRNGLRMWLGNGPLFCDIETYRNEPSYFGLFWRHWVWWAAARGMKRSADKSRRAPVLVLK